jgi:hypothetical protein
MKKIIVSIGFAALGVSTLHAQYSPSITPEELSNPRGWSIATTLRGFYNDNPFTEPNAVARSTYGTEVSPSVAFNHTYENTTVTLGYIFDWLYYDRYNTSDTSHQFNADVKQTFSDRYSMEVSDSFVVAQQPGVLDTTIINSPLYAPGNNIHNNGNISFTAGLVPKLDLQVSYANNLYAYQQTYGDVFQKPGTALESSWSAILDRMEQLATVNLNWKVLNELTGVLGYSYGHTGFTSPEPIIFGPTATAAMPFTTDSIYSQVRDNDAHFFFVGADEHFTSTLSGSIRAGGEYLDYYNANTTDLSPYVDASLTWTYMPESYVQGGVKHEHSATDVLGALPSAGGQPVLDAEDTAAYVSLSQKISGGFTGGLLGQYQHSVFNGGTVNNESENFFILGLNFSYRFNPYLNAETGYNWNKLVSDVSGRDYTQNMVYVGVRATY